MDEFNNNLNSDNNIDNFNKEDNKSFDFDLSILDRVKPPQVEIEKKDEVNPIDEVSPIELDTEKPIEEETPFVGEINPIDEIHPVDLEEHIDSSEEEKPFVEETSPMDEIHPVDLEEHIDSPEEIPFVDQVSSIEEPTEEKEDNIYNDNPFINNNPYEETIENTNPYVDYDNMEAVIGTPIQEQQVQETKSEPIYEEEIPKEVSEKQEVTNYTKNIDTDFKDLEKEQKKQTKKDNTKFIFLFLMFVVIAGLIAYFHFSGEKKKPNEIKDIDIQTGEKKEEPKKEEKEPPVVEQDFSKQIESELNNYYSDGDTNGLSSLLSNSSSDATKIDDIHNVTYTEVTSWIDRLITNDSKDYETFTSEVNNIRSKIDGLYNLKYSDIGYIEEDKYSEFTSKLNKIDEDSNDYYVALELFNNKDYNNAYKSFEAINNNSTFYTNSTKHMEDIIANILDLLKGDIKTISTNLDYVSEEEQQVKYKQIKGIIEKYAIAYPYVKLSNNEEYNSLLKKYTELIKE